VAGTSFTSAYAAGLQGPNFEPEVKSLLDDAFLEVLAAAGTPARITFNGPDTVIGVETVADHGGLSLWTRDEMERYPFLSID